MNTIGKISSGFRFIKSGTEFNHLFPTASNKDKIALHDAEVTDTVQLMGKIVSQTLNQTQVLAKKLKDGDLRQTCQNVWDFLYNHIQYKLDQAGLEQLRQPARSWHDRHSGIDCDCFSIFVSSILTNLNIKHAFRITKYDRDVFQHVYVIVPIPSLKNKYYTIDCVLSQFDYEKPYSEKKDFVMKHSLNGIDVAVLSGFDPLSGDDEYLSLLYGDVFDGVALGAISEEEAVYQHLISTRNIVSEKPYLIAALDDPEAFLQMLDYAIEHWNTPQRDEALEVLAKNEYAINKLNGFFDDTLTGNDDELFGEDELYGDDENYLLGKPKKKKFFRKVRTKGSRKKKKSKNEAIADESAFQETYPSESQAPNPSNETPTETIFQAGSSYSAERQDNTDFNTDEDLEGLGKGGVLKKIGKGVAKVTKKVGKAIVRYNPVTIAARSGLLLALKLNISKMSSKLKWAYATEQQAAKKGISKAKWLASKKSLIDTEKLFEKLGGKKSALKNPITKGKAGGLNGETYDLGELNGLGVAPLAASVAAAIPVIAKVILSLKNNKLMDDKEAQAAEAELNNSQGLLEEEMKKNTNESDISDDSDKSKKPIPKWVVPAVIGVGVLGAGIYFATRNKKKPSNRSQALSGVKSTPKSLNQPKLKRIELK